MSIYVNEAQFKSTSLGQYIKLYVWEKYESRLIGGVMRLLISYKMGERGFSFKD